MGLCMKRIFLAGKLFVVAVICAACTTSTIQPIVITPISSSEGARFSVFEAHNAAAPNAINYDGLSYFLSALVIDVGFSDRQRGGDGDDTLTGSRIPRGSSDLLVLETNRIDFANLSDNTINQITEYRKLLEQLPSQRPLREFNRNDQLAFWINLHNIALVEQIALRYPVPNLNRFFVNTDNGREHIYDAKLLNIQGVELSLNDIRINIVYRYWNDMPEVMYGFFLGTLGGPSLIPRAYSADFVHNYLNRNASEFVNSLRGTKNFYSTLYVSSLYFSHQEIFFPDWPTDFVDHLKTYARSPVSRYLQNVKQVNPLSYAPELAAIYSSSDNTAVLAAIPFANQVSREATGQTVIAGANDPGALGGSAPDLSGVALPESLSDGLPSSSTLDASRQEFFSRIERKKRRSSQDFWPTIPHRQGSVEIIDVPTDDN